MRPADFDEFVGQEHILGCDKLMRRIIESDRIIPMIFWGPPGCGKTTLARIIASKTKSKFRFFSAVTNGVKDVREIIDAARSDLQLYSSRTILFVDEIHRFNKSQQDAFLPFVEDGTIILLGATTENPSFEVNAPLLSRARVFHFRELSTEDIIKLLNHSIEKINENFRYYFPTINKANFQVSIDKKALDLIAARCDGDVRNAYNALELAVISAKAKGKKITIDEATAEESIQKKAIYYDKGADGHFDAISALHKSLRSSDVDGSLHYLARMLEAGEDPLYVVRRLIRFASEDIGIADPQALILAVATFQTVHFLGMPECNDAMAELTIYLAKAPKSRAVDDAYAKAKADVLEKRLDPVPLEIRNAPTKMMKDFGFGKGYEMYTKKSRLPENLKGKKYFDEKDSSSS